MTTMITKGDVGALVPAPGWTIENDGFGLLTSSVVFRGDKDAELPAIGDDHPEDSRLKLHKLSWSRTSGDTITATAYYLGIESGDHTTIEYESDVASSVNPLKAHPKFLATAYNGASGSLQSYGWDDSLGGYPSDSTDASDVGLTGVRNYVAGEQSITGTFYTNSKTYLQNTVNAQGKTFESLLGDENLVIPDDNVPISANHDRIGLVASVGYKLYAKGIWKVHFTCRVSPGGWHKYVYRRVPTT